MEQLQGGICAPKGFKATGIHCGLRKNPGKKDLALIVSEVPAQVALVTTQNIVKAAPVIVTKAHAKQKVVKGIICNSGNANACTPNGMEAAESMCQLTANALGVAAEEILVGSTGVIGQPLDITPIANNMTQLVESLNDHGSDDCASAIMTTDLVKKEIAVSLELSGKTVTIGGISKGSGMIHPNMATMLGFITTDATISSDVLQVALSKITAETFNMISVDGDTSTNDMVIVLANGMAGNEDITENSADYQTFYEGLLTVATYLAKSIAADGEGASKLLQCTISGADHLNDARVLAKSVIQSSLFKAAMFGEDANWGRILCAMGYSGATFDPEAVTVTFHSSEGDVIVCQDGASVNFDEAVAAKVLSSSEIIIDIVVGTGTETATAWGCDLTYDYVKINGDYRS